MQPRFSIVIPLHRDGVDFRRSVASCLEQRYPDFELVVVADRPVDGLPSGVGVIETSSATATSPAEKRDLAFAATTGDVLAFIDDDAYPAPEWLTNAARYFADPGVHALGGPGLTPSEAPWSQRVGGAVYESPAGSASLRHRFLPLPHRWVDDHPAYNLFVRRDALAAVGGWGTTFYGGEDTVLCLKLARAGRRVLYAPDVAVYHIRRPILRGHLRQVANVGRHRGHFARAYPESSRRPVYFLPMLAPLAAAAAAVSVKRRPRLALPAAMATYAAVAAETLRRHPPDVAVVTPLAVAAHHLAYGLAFVRGFVGPPLER